MTKILNLELLKQDIPIVTPVIGAFMAQAAAVSLVKNGHISGTKLKLNEDLKDEFLINWDENISEKILKGWLDLREAAEYGALAITILVLIASGEYNYFERMHQGAGFDYWVDSYEGDIWDNNFQEKKARLEVSGILKEIPGNTVGMRVSTKMKQIKNDNFNMPAIISVVEFSVPKIQIVKI